MNDYDCEIRYHPGKANVVADALSRKERIKPRRVKALGMTVRNNLIPQIKIAQEHALKDDEIVHEMLKGLKQQLESKTDNALYFMNRLWIPFYGNIRQIILDEAHK